MHATAVAKTGMFRNLEDRGAERSGTIYETEDFFTLSARDYSGKEWTAERVLPSSSWYSGHVLTTGSLNSLSLAGLLPAEDIPSENYVRLHFFDSADVPCTQFRDLGVVGIEDRQRNFAAFDAVNCSFEVKRFADEFIVQATSKDPVWSKN